MEITSTLITCLCLLGLSFMGKSRCPDIGWLTVPYFFLQWLVIELAWLLAATQSIYMLYLIYDGALSSVTGWLSVSALAMSLYFLWQMHLLAESTGEYLNRALQLNLGDDFLDKIPANRRSQIRTVVSFRQWFRPFNFKKKQVKHVRNIAYGTKRRQLLDIFYSDTPPIEGKKTNDGKTQKLRPVLLQIHGGGWIIGQKEHQGQPLMRHMAENGWICVAINYRLGPKHRFPAQIIDVKTAISWVKKHIHHYGGDPDFIITTGGSAGGHLCALSGLTANNPLFQPGFESEDTRVQACVPFYGVYDLLDRHNTRGNAEIVPFLTQYVMPSPPEEDGHLWELCSPISQVHENSPPFFIIHGEFDTLAFVEEARIFTKALRDVSKSSVTYAELADTQHAFEIFHSVRTEHTINAVQTYCEYQYSRYINGYTDENNTESENSLTQLSLDISTDND